MDVIVEFGSPLLLTSFWQKVLFLLAPAVLAPVGALLGQGSWLRIAGAAAGAMARDLVLLLLVVGGLLHASNPHYSLDCALILAYLGGAGAALLACLAPYRGRLLLVMTGLGGFGGQFLLPPILGLAPEVKDPMAELLKLAE